MTYTHDFGDGLTWIKARASGDQGGSCAYVTRRGDGMVGIRDSKQGNTGRPQWYHPDTWATFLTGIRVGDFENL